MIYNKFGNKCQSHNNMQIQNLRSFLTFNISFSITCYIKINYFAKIHKY